MARNWIQLGSISSYCPLDCRFCFRKGQSKTELLHNKPSFKKIDDVKKICKDILNNNIRYDFMEDVGEYLVNKDFFPILKEFRSHFPDETIDFTTSAITLTKERVGELGKYNPIFLQVSLNSANPDIRKSVMNDKDPMVAIESIKYFKDNGIIYSGNIVAWPTIPIDDIVETIFYFDKHMASTIKINLPSYSKFHPTDDIHLFNVSTWDNIVKVVEVMRTMVSTPILIEPFMYKNSPVKPVISGVIKNSPAYYAGIMEKDIISKINSKEILYREQARNEMIQKSEDDIYRSIELVRGSEVVNIDLYDSKKEYPYATKKHSRVGKMFGLIIHQGIDLKVFSQIKEQIVKHQSKHTVVIGSEILFNEMYNLIGSLKDSLFKGIKIELIKAKNIYYGGNVVVGDLLVVSDFIGAIKEYCSKNVEPDLITIPGTSFNYGKDLLGISHKEIEYATGIKVELIHMDRILV